MLTFSCCQKLKFVDFTSLYCVPQKYELQRSLATGFSGIVHFTVFCLVTSSLNESEAGVDLVLIETSLLYVNYY